MKRLALTLLVIFPLFALSQPKKVVNIPVQEIIQGSSGLCLRNAMRLWMMTFQENYKDTTIAIYIRQSVYWTATMWHPMNFIANGYFDSLQRWSFFNNANGDGKFWIDTVHEAGAVTFTTGAVTELRQINSSNIFHPNKRYRLYFNAFARKGSRIGIDIVKEQDPTVKWFSTTEFINSSPYVYTTIPHTFEFVMPASVVNNDNGLIRFTFANATPNDTIYFTAMRLQEQVVYPEVKISVDSIVGRGANRKAKIILSHKTDSSAYWKITGHDTSGQVLIEHATLDSTSANYAWLGYTYDIDPNCKIHTNQFDYFSGAIWGRHWGAGDVDMVMDMRMQKILGDPTVNSGYDQRVLLRIRAHEAPSVAFSDWIETLSNRPIDYWAPKK